MRFAVVSTIFAGAAMAGWAEEEKSTVYATEVKTITSCGPEVPDCPGATATYVPVEDEYEVPYEAPVPAATATYVPVEDEYEVPYEAPVPAYTPSPYSPLPYSHAPYEETGANSPAETTMVKKPAYNGTMPHPSTWGSTWAPHPTKEACPGYSVKTISTSVTTVIPTVIYETMDVPCETEAPVYTPVGSGGGYVSPSTGYPNPTETPIFTGAASSLSFSVAAVAAGLVAFLA